MNAIQRSKNMSVRRQVFKEYRALRRELENARQDMNKAAVLLYKRDGNLNALLSSEEHKEFDRILLQFEKFLDEQESNKY